MLIAGGGIGGLSTAIALARQGLPSRILERRSEFSEAGAGIQIGPNVMRVLASLDVTPHLTEFLAFPDDIHIRDGASGRVLTSVPLGPTAKNRYGAPYGTAHRRDLQAALLATARNCPEIEITSGFEISRYSEEADSVTVYSASDETVRGTLLVGADGLSSRIRAQLNGDARLQFFGRTAWRSLIDADSAPPLLKRNAVGLWLGQEAHLVHYPVRGGEAINLVAVIEDAWDREGWNTKADPADLISRFSGWCEAARSVLQAGVDWRKWALFELTDLERWHGRRTVLMGDAAHPVLPFLAQGAGLAIEDALVLARELAARNGSDPDPAFEAYSKARKARAAQVQNQSRRMGAIYHYGGPVRLLRNAAMRFIGPAGNLARFDWLYRFKA